MLDARSLLVECLLRADEREKADAEFQTLLRFYPASREVWQLWYEQLMKETSAQASTPFQNRSGLEDQAARRPYRARPMHSPPRSSSFREAFVEAHAVRAASPTALAAGDGRGHGPRRKIERKSDFLLAPQGRNDAYRNRSPLDPFVVPQEVNTCRMHAVIEQAGSPACSRSKPLTPGGSSRSPCGRGVNSMSSYKINVDSHDWSDSYFD